MRLTDNIRGTIVGDYTVCKIVLLIADRTNMVNSLQ